MDIPYQKERTQTLLNEPWLESCLRETLLPGSSWHKVINRVGAVFAEKVRPFLSVPKDRQMIFKLLGNNFVKQHFRNDPNILSLLYPPEMSSVEYEKLEKNQQSLLLNLWTKAVEQTQCHLSGDSSELSAEMTSFVNYTFNLIESKMKWILAQYETSNMKEYSGVENEPLALRLISRRRPKSVESKDLSFAIDRTETFKLNIYKDPGTGQLKNPPPLSSAGSEILGNALCSIISSDANTMKTIYSRLRGHLLPKALRQSIWADKLLRSEKTLKGEIIKLIEKDARERYGKTLDHRCAELKLRSATRSPISGLIENAVIEKYRSTPSMYQFAKDEQMINEASKSLNILYVYNGTYEPYVIHWLFPLQIAFRQILHTAEHPYELFMYLHLLIKNIFPSWLEMSAIAERVMDTLQTEDTELYTYFQLSFQKDVIFNPDDLLMEPIVQEKDNPRTPYVSVRKVDDMDLRGNLLENPVIIFRKWMAEGFVNLLDLPAVMLIWDQLFMQGWNPKVMESFCLTLLMLLRDAILTANNYPAIRQVLLNGGYHLLTADIQKAWIHLQNGGVLADISGMNRLKLRQVRELSPRLQDKRRLQDFGKILPFGVQNIVLKLSPTEYSFMHTSLKDFNPKNVTLMISVYYGITKICSKMSSSKLTLHEKVTSNKTLNKDSSFLLQYNNYFEFESLDLDYTKYGEKPFLLLKAVHTAEERAPETLGWTKVDAFEKEATSTQEIWKPREFSSLLSLHPGEELDNINESTSGISRSESHDSTIKLTVYDPRKNYLHKIITLDEGSRNIELYNVSHIPAWVQHSESTLLPHSTTLKEPFNLYIDALHYIPDCATITKVSAQIINPRSKSQPSYVAFPNINSSARNPIFNFHQLLNTADGELHVTTYILFKVLTVDVDFGSISIIGNCMLRVFNNDGKLNTGGFQLRLRTGLPSKKLDALTPADLEKYPAFPCCSLMVRLLPYSERSEPVPSYASGYYFTDEAKPTRSELEIISTFQQDTSFPKQVKDMAEQLMDKEQSQVPENQIIDWYKKRIGGDQSSLLQSSLSYCNIHHAVRYQQHSGLKVQVKQAFGLEVEGLYINAFARILKGAQSIPLPELPQNWGGDEKLLTQQLDFTSLQRSPKWNDPSVVLHPYLDNNSVLLVQVFGMAAKYVPHASSDQRGRVISRDGQELELQPPLGWTVFTLFDRRYINSGLHSAPLFQGFPNADFLQTLSMTPVKSAIEDALKKKTILLQKLHGSIILKIWDGHYTDEEHALPVLNDLLTVSSIKKFLATQKSKKGKDMSMLVIESLDKKQQKLEKNSPGYQRHLQFYKEAMGDTFYDLIETALLNAGYGPL